MSGIIDETETTTQAAPTGELEKAPRRSPAPRRRAQAAENTALVAEAVQAAGGPPESFGLPGENVARRAELENARRAEMIRATEARVAEAHRLALEAEQSGEVRKLARAVRLMLEVSR